MILWVIEHSATDRLEASESTWLGRKHVVVTYHLFLCLSPGALASGLRLVTKVGFENSKNGLRKGTTL
ncbi:hypothetical protein LR48_Vigan04g185000 [Vigna angularis]|uniref:Uncharacterized protein n=1 Tax=Phaseolus angularis TaxID=3914 RepID=A0A0L9UGG4_PHAAN|nr:hypothetical protein LR48_Vigan04g185000 [Vigna angularis]